MSQADVLEFLEKKPRKWFVATEIAAGLNRTPNHVNGNLRKLRKSPFIQFRKIDFINDYNLFHRPIYEYKKK